MNYINLLLWLGVSILFFGFAGVMGVLIRSTQHGAEWDWKRLLTIVYAALLFLPASILVLGLQDWPLWARWLVVTAGIGTAWLGYKQPARLPKHLWGRAFAQRYFAVAMAFAMAWGFCLTLATRVFHPVPVTAAASLAGIVSLLTAPRLS
ncbi:MAG: hypothetical protein GTO14_09655 [Anaerolineales bacterium]|nr:hypothetical protein [Anaerolineales bacterium]